MLQLVSVRLVEPIEDNAIAVVLAMLHHWPRPADALVQRLTAPLPEHVRARLDGLIAQLRSAERGYSGALDFVRIREQQLDQIYQLDLTLLTAIDEFP